MGTERPSFCRTALFISHLAVKACVAPDCHKPEWPKEIYPRQWHASALFAVWRHERPPSWDSPVHSTVIFTTLNKSKVLPHWLMFVQMVVESERESRHCFLLSSQVFWAHSATQIPSSIAPRRYFQLGQANKNYKYSRLSSVCYLPFTEGPGSACRVSGTGEDKA